MLRHACCHIARLLEGGSGRCLGRRVFGVVLLALGIACACGHAPSKPHADAGPDSALLDGTAPPDAGPLGPTALTALWANSGEDKVPAEDLRATGNPSAVHNRHWDGARVNLFGARDEVVAFAVILEAGNEAVPEVTVRFDRLWGPGGSGIQSRAATGDGLFDWRGRNIEVFFVRYLQIRGLSAMSYEHYDERHIPERFRRPFAGEGQGSGEWADRPDHDKHYPDIAVPVELEEPFTVAQGTSQTIWVDVHIPRNAAPGRYSGSLEILEAGIPTHRIPVELTVRSFTLPSEPALKTMVYVGYGDINERYLGAPWPWEPADLAASRLIRDRHFQLAHRHRVSLFDSDEGSEAWTQDRPRPEWEPRLDGSLFTPAQGYEGPGEGLGTGLYVIGAYGGWGWQGGGQTAMSEHTDRWETWFQASAPDTFRFLYLIDESTDYAQIQQWANWIITNPGPGRELLSFATLAAPEAVANTPSLSIAASWMTVGITAEWEAAAEALRGGDGHWLFLYNGNRPAAGSFATEDDGVALRALAWAQHKHRIDRWFFWESTYYTNFQAGLGATNVFETAATFGMRDQFDPSLGEWGWNHSNGDGVLFYPGTDMVFPQESYDVQGPLASLRLKLWRRGLQDGDYLALAHGVDPVRTASIVAQLLPISLWEHGVEDPQDPTWVRADISWPTDPDLWDAAREELADIIEGG